MKSFLYKLTAPVRNLIVDAKTIIWAGKKDCIHKTIIVIVVSIIVGAFLILCDFLFGFLITGTNSYSDLFTSDETYTEEYVDDGTEDDSVYETYIDGELVQFDTTISTDDTTIAEDIISGEISLDVSEEVVAEDDVTEETSEAIETVEETVEEDLAE